MSDETASTTTVTTDAGKATVTVTPSSSVQPIEVDKLTVREMIIEFFQEDNGGMSMTRLLSFISFASVLVIYIYHGFRDEHMPDIPGGALGLLGIAAALKFSQKVSEPKTPIFEEEHHHE